MHMSTKTKTAFILAFMLPACNDSGTNNGASAEAGESSGAGPTTDPTGPDTASGETTTTAGASTTNAATSTVTAADETTAGESEDEGPSIYLDVGQIPDTPGAGECEGKNGGKGGGGGGGGPDFSFIWIANSIEDTVSKIDTETMEEVGRYRTRLAAGGSPSRTSVNLNGDVAVANRTGGVTKIYANIEACDDPSNTSSGAADVKPFPDGCVAWHTPLAYASNRPVAWTSGVWSGITCRYEDTKLWTSGANATIDVLLLDGETGVIEQTVPIPGVQPQFYGIYGGATDADNNFWGGQLGQGFLVYVDFEDYDFETYPMPIAGYGVTVDQDGYAYTCSSGVAKFDPATDTWQTNANVGGGGGCMTDGLGTLWIGGYGGGGGLGGQMIGIDTDTMAVTQNIPIPNYVHGISVDFYGYVWGVTLQTPEAYKVDPIAATYETFTGLTGPYTYSDMTGYALSNASGLPPSG